MSDIESAAKPILLPMMSGQPRSLSPDDQQVVATWAQLKALCWHALKVSEGAEPAFDDLVYRQFRTARPLDWAVNLVHVESGGAAEIDFGFLHGLDVEDSEASRLFRCSVRFDQMYLGVSASMESNGLPTSDELANLVPHSHRLWPPSAAGASSAIDWPPNLHRYTALERRGILYGDPLALTELEENGSIAPNH